MPRPKLTAYRMGTLERLEGHTRGATFIVDVCELRPHGAPPSVRPRFVRLEVLQHGVSTDKQSRPLTIRTTELRSLVGLLEDAARFLGLPAARLEPPAEPDDVLWSGAFADVLPLASS